MGVDLQHLELLALFAERVATGARFFVPGLDSLAVRASVIVVMHFARVLGRIRVVGVDLGHLDPLTAQALDNQRQARD